eukprot:11885095-Ditylum_brightwellii.AAC.1
MHHSGNAMLCSVRLWVETSRHIRSLPGTKDSWTVDIVLHCRQLRCINATEVLTNICTAVTCIVKDKLGFTAAKMGTHSNQSSAAMAMYLANTPVFTIMLIRCWSFDAFLLYIRKQVQDFTKGISGKMLISLDYFTIPDKTANHKDPQTWMATNNFALRLQNGGNITQHIMAPCFVLHH